MADEKAESWVGPTVEKKDVLLVGSKVATKAGLRADQKVVQWVHQLVGVLVDQLDDCSAEPTVARTAYSWVASKADQSAALWAVGCCPNGLSAGKQARSKGAQLIFLYTTASASYCRRLEQAPGEPCEVRR